MYPSEREEFQWAINDRKALHAKENAAKDAEIHSLRTALNRAFDDLVTLRREIAALTPSTQEPQHTGWGPGKLRDCHCANCQGETTQEPQTVEPITVWASFVPGGWRRVIARTGLLAVLREALEASPVAEALVRVGEHAEPIAESPESPNEGAK